MAYRTLISAAELAANLEDENWAVIDCRFSLADTEQGRRLYLTSHIPGAIYAHIDEDLSAGDAGKTAATRCRNQPPWRKSCLPGASTSVQVVAYDDSGGAMARGCGGCCAGWAMTLWPWSTGAGRSGKRRGCRLRRDQQPHAAHLCAQGARRYGGDYSGVK